MALLTPRRTREGGSRKRTAGFAALVLTGLLVSRLLGGQASAAQTDGDANALPEYVVKAGFLFNFAKYVDWPAGSFEGPGEPITIGIVGKDPFGSQLEQILKDKKVKERPFAIVRFTDAESIRRCHILFVPRSEAARLSGILDRVVTWPVLTVGEYEGFSRAGGTLAILVENDKPRLEINTDAAGRAGLIISTKLLKAATLVRTVK